MAPKRRINGKAIWTIEATIEYLEKGLTTQEEIRQKNPGMLVAIDKFKEQLAQERAAEVPYARPPH